VDVVTRMMHLNPEERFQTAADVRRALEPLVARYPVDGGTPMAGARAGGAERAAAKVVAAPATVKGTLMLAEASPQEQAELRGVFKNLGYKVLLTENLQRALVRCSATPRAADCLVISAASFGEPGVEVFNTLAQDPSLRDVPAVLLVDPTQRELADRVQVDDRRRMVQVPLQTAELTEVLDALLGQSEPGRLPGGGR
jgi:CheY-like chemotaxis protein